MPVEVVGLSEARKAMRALQPELSKELTKEIKTLLAPVIKSAKQYVPNENHGLTNWFYNSKPNKITSHNSMFRVGKFPKFNPNEVKAGIKAEFSPTRRGSKGFVSLVRIVNTTRAGAIFETAGRKHPSGQPWDRKNGSHKVSHSLNPKAGEHFINSLIGEFKGSDNKRGRLIYRAWAENQGRALGAILQAIEKTAIKTTSFVDNAKAFRKAA